MRWSDLTVVRPEDGPTIGLPPMLGAILMTLLEQSKSTQHATADVVVDYTTYSGLSLGNWLELLAADLPSGETESNAFVLCKSNGSAWTSHLYRHQFLYPALYACQASGDPLSCNNLTELTALPSRWRSGVSTPNGARAVPMPPRSEL
jgi:hypothetical protein